MDTDQPIKIKWAETKKRGSFGSTPPCYSSSLYLDIFNRPQRRTEDSGGAEVISVSCHVVAPLNACFKEGVIPIQDQVQQFQTLVNENKLDKKLVQKSLFLFESGSNDIFNYYNPFAGPTNLDPEAYVQAMLTQVKQFIDQIYSLGARRIVIIALGPVGCVPARMLLPGGRTDRCFGRINHMVKKYNAGLEGLVKDTPITHPGAIGVYGEVYKAVQEFRSMPKRYGFFNITGACCGDGTLGGLVQCGKDGYKVCENPNQFLFWDFFHPSEHTYELVSKALWAGKQSRVRPINLRTLASISV